VVSGQVQEHVKVLARLGTFDFQTFDLGLKILSSPMSFAIKLLKQVSQFVSHRILPQASFLPSTFRLSTFGLLFTFNFPLLIFNSCGLDIEDSTPPSKPQWVQKSLPEEWPERGIDAHESVGIFLEWEPNPVQENVTFYLLHRAEYFVLEDSLGDFELLSTLMLKSSSASEYVDRSTMVNTRYHYVLIAKDASENQSTPSDTLGYMRITAINSAWMLPNGLSVALPPDRKLQWRYVYDVAMENYTMTILSADNGLILRRELTPGNYIGGTEYFTIPDTIVLSSGSSYKWRVDMGARYAEGRETIGSESSWVTFLYSGL
jgi:hypothetical protein